MERKWWKESVVYQIYPRSYKDSNGDGVGDLRGVIEKVDYIKNLGVNVIWFNPIYSSPNADNGYDISDYKNIMREFGTMEDFEELLDKLHKKDIKVIMDLVVNHTSDEHKWFQESKKSKDNPYRDYYIWRDGKKGENGELLPPNNWTSYFGGPAWKYDETTGQFYMHLFHEKQPDLNWENPKVVESIHEMMHWWFNKGIDGFRMDVINMISKVDGLPDGKLGNYIVGGENYLNGPRYHEFMHDMNQKVLSKYDVMTVGECPGTAPEEALKAVQADREELNMVFHFEHMSIDGGRKAWEYQPWKLTDLKKLITRWNWVTEQGGWNSNYLMNHDQPRALSRFGNDEEYRVESGKMLALFNITLPGTPYVYQGEEIGMINTKFTHIDEFDDVESIGWYNIEAKKGRDTEELIEILNVFSRDHSRTPIHWDESENAGFTTGKPWLRLNDNYDEINVKKALEDKNSIFYFYKEVIEIRRREEALSYGDFEMVMSESEEIFAYKRRLNQEEWLVLLNFSGGGVETSLDLKDYEVVISNYEKTNSSKLLPYEGKLLKKLNK